EAGCEVVEYSPAEVKRAVVGYGRAEKHQVQQMIKLLLGLRQAPTPYDAADALAVAICHLHSGLAIGDQGLGIGQRGSGARDRGFGKRNSQPPIPDSRSPIPRSWRRYRPPTG